jgi:RNA polymerase sigma-70 factor (ECF subfamily)
MRCQQENIGPVLEANVATRVSLLRRVRDWEDNASWQEFFDLYWKLIYTLGLRAGLTECEAEEVVQTTMISVARKIGHYRPNSQNGSFRRWIRRQAQWKISDQLRQRFREQKRRRPSHPSNDDAATRTGTIARVPDPRNELAHFVQEDWDRAVAEVAVARVKRVVKPKHFQIYDLHIVKKWPIREVARLLQVNIAQVYLTKSRVARLLRQKTKEVEAQLERLPSEVQKPENQL